ncbi:MAG: hypothetical protein N3G77_04535, partial [Nitrososphaeria archaeon]|nr:hypothetical protein [Nitrososphaeria archaeon]
VIVFMIFIPLFLYLQSLQTIFMQEASRRLQYELERIHEELEVSLTIKPAEGGDVVSRILITMYNPGTLTVSVPTIYIESKNEGLTEISKQFFIPPGSVFNYIIEDFSFSRGEESDVVRARVVTLRGNGYISREQIGPKNLTYNLVILLSNMSFGHVYEIVVEVMGVGYGFGCIQTDQKEVCKSRGSIAVVPQSFNDTSRIVFFKVAPGVYDISIKDSSRNLIVESYRDGVEVRDDVILNINLPRIVFPETVPLKVQVLNKNMTVVIGETSSQIKVQAPYTISLGTIAESLVDVTIKIECHDGCSVEPPSEKMIKKIYPGETYLDSFNLTVPGGQPELISYKVKIEEATGELSGYKYKNPPEGTYKIEKPEDSGEIVVCKIRKLTILMPGGKEEQINYLECPAK